MLTLNIKFHFFLLLCRVFILLLFLNSFRLMQVNSCVGSLGYWCLNLVPQPHSCLNSEFSFSETSYHTKVKEYSLTYYLPIVEESRWIHAFLKGISSKVNHKQSHLGFEFSLPSPFPVAITVRLCTSHNVPLDTSFILNILVISLAFFSCWDHDQMLLESVKIGKYFYDLFCE